MQCSQIKNKLLATKPSAITAGPLPFLKAKKRNNNKLNQSKMKKKITPPHLSYEKPQMRIVEIVHSSALLQSSPGGGQGILPPTGNDNSDDDWASLTNLL